MSRLLLWTFLMVTVTAWGQTTVEPFKKANTILIETGLKADSMFVVWGRHLAQNGYAIEKSDNNFFTMTTGPKDTSKFNVDFFINSVVLSDGTIKIKIKWRVKSSMLAGTNSTDYYDWEYASSKGNIQYVIHEDFLKTVKTFGDFQVKYSKE
ncbi:MAG: hypothetical protein R2820_07225 [Cyclobacteriaceae bacterium]